MRDVTFTKPGNYVILEFIRYGVVLNYISDLMTMNMEAYEYIEGEKLLLSKNANLIIRRTEFDLPPLVQIGFCGRLGMKGKEAIGGQLHFTSYRLIFKSHSFNRVTGSISVFLPQITSLKNTSSPIVRRVTLSTLLAKMDFVVFGISALIEKIHEAQKAFGQNDKERVVMAVTANPSMVGSLRISTART